MPLHPFTILHTQKRVSQCAFCINLQNRFEFSCLVLAITFTVENYSTVLLADDSLSNYSSIVQA